MERQTISLHFIVEGRWFTKKIQDAIIEHNLTKANKYLDQLKPIPAFDERQALFTGNGQIVGNTLCDNPECSQCKPLRKFGDFAFVKKPDLKYKKRLEQHKTYTRKYLIEVDGDTTIEKTVVADLVIKKFVLEETKKLRYKNREPERLSSKNISKRYLEALDEWELSQDRLYQSFGISRLENYTIGSREWKSKMDADSIMDIVEAKSIYIPEIKEIIEHFKETGSYTVHATEKYFNLVEQQREVIHNSVMNDDCLVKDEITRIKKINSDSIEKISIGSFNVPKNVLDDYLNHIKSANTKMLIKRSRFGELDPLEELDRLNKRIELHKAIFEALKLPYHADIDTRKHLTKEQKESIEFQEQLSRYTDENVKLE